MTETESPLTVAVFSAAGSWPGSTRRRSRGDVELALVARAVDHAAGDLADGAALWVHTALNALNSPAVGWVTTKSPVALMMPPPTGTSAVFTGLPLGAGADAEPVADALVAEEDVEDPDEVVEADVVVEGAVVVGVVEPPHAARAAVPATPAPLTPAARRTVRRFMAVSPPVASPGVLLVVVLVC